MTTDSGVEDTIVVHLGKNQEIKFTRCGHLLYYFDTTNASPVETPQDNITDSETIDKSKSSATSYSVVSTVATNKEYFTRRKIEGADNSQLL